jgi:cell division protein WhiA
VFDLSFSQEVKKELAKLPLENECCYLSELAAIIKTSADIMLEKGKFAIVIKTEVAELYEKINKIFEKLYGFSVELEISEDESFFHGVRYEIKIDTEHADRVLTDCGIIYKNEEHETQFNSGIDKYLVMDECCKRSFIRGAFIGCATSSIVLTKEDQEKNKKPSSGYHLEFVFSNEELALDFGALLAEFNIMSKKVTRKYSHIVYLKEGDLISDILALIGASNTVMKLQNEIILRSLRNKVNRQNNCDTGNISKVVNASLKQIEAIKTISETIGVESLPIALQEVAMLRLANQEESLDTLVTLSTTLITKSGLNHRFRKLIEIAKELSGK